MKENTDSCVGQAEQHTELFWSIFPLVTEMYISVNSDCFKKTDNNTNFCFKMISITVEALKSCNKEPLH